MKLYLPRKRAIRAFHRWLGMLSATFLIILSLTGLALNHTEFLRLDHVQVRNSTVLKRYGMVGSDAIHSYRLGDKDTLSELNERLFYNLQSMNQAGKVVGIFEGDPINVIATATNLIFITVEGEWVETLGADQLPFGELIAIGRSPDNQAVLVAENGSWITDADWLNFQTYDGAYSIEPPEPVALDSVQKSALLTAYQGGGVSLYRLLLDLHSGRLLGWGGRTAMDLTAVAILILISSGIGGWRRKSRNQKEVSRI